MSKKSKKRNKNNISLRGIGMNSPVVFVVKNGRAQKPFSADAKSDDFLQSFEWRKLRLKIIKKYGATCQCCGASPQTGAVINVDHIKPRKLFPNLSLDENNLQVLCNDCNHGKGNWDQTDWRPSDAISYDPATEFIHRIKSM
jgi:hypothetical protein